MFSILLFGSSVVYECIIYVCDPMLLCLLGLNLVHLNVYAYHVFNY